MKIKINKKQVINEITEEEYEFVKEALENQVVEDLYFGEESAATLKKFLDILEKIEKKMATTKSINTFEKIFKQFDVDD